MDLCVRGTDCDSVSRSFAIRLWNCLDSVVIFVLDFLTMLMRGIQISSCENITDWLGYLYIT
jgi:hypothetical protein